MLLPSTLVTLAMLLIVVLRVDTRRSPVKTEDEEWQGEIENQVAGEKEGRHDDERCFVRKG